MYHGYLLSVAYPLPLPKAFTQDQTENFSLSFTDCNFGDIDLLPPMPHDDINSTNATFPCLPSSHPVLFILIFWIRTTTSTFSAAIFIFACGKFYSRVLLNLINFLSDAIAVLLINI